LHKDNVLNYSRKHFHIATTQIMTYRVKVYTRKMAY